MTSEANSSVQLLLTQVLQAVAQLVQASNQQRENLEILVDQVGRLTEQTVMTDRKLDRIVATAETQAETAKQQADTAKIQAESVVQLIAMLNRRGA